MTRKALQNSDDLIRLVNRWKKVKIVVVGDFMLDHYIFGDAQRLSLDAPVPVLAAHDERYTPGGAANVCLDLCALRCQVACVGVVGTDESGRTLRNSLKRSGCDVSGLVKTPDRPTTVKQNFIGLAQHRHPQKMFRVDLERTEALPGRILRKLAAAVRAQIQAAHVICLEDYDKGVLGGNLTQTLIQMAHQYRKPILVDPAAIDDYRKYRGATCITPNRTEASRATRIQDKQVPRSWQQIARTLLRQLEIGAVVLTLDKHGVLLHEKHKRGQLHPTQSRTVYDVTGAGDMVLAMLAAAFANGATWKQAVQLANIAGGLEVEQFGVVPIELHEILLALLQQRHESLGKQRDLEQMLPELAAHRKRGRRVAFTNGCFDILHAGHVRYLRKAAETSDLLVVAVNSDESIGRIKGSNRPVNQLADRLMVLSELECIDYLVVFDQDTPMKLIRSIKPDVLVKGGDYQRRDVVGADLVESYGGQVVLVRLVKGKSTTNIIRRINRKKKRKGQPAKSL